MRLDYHPNQNGGVLLRSGIGPIFLRLDACGHRTALKRVRIRASVEKFIVPTRHDLFPQGHL